MIVITNKFMDLNKFQYFYTAYTSNPLGQSNEIQLALPLAYYKGYL